MRLVPVIRRISLGGAILLFIAGYSLPAFADDPSNSGSSVQSTDSSSAPTDNTTYWYDSSSHHWNSNHWTWDSGSNSYKPYVPPTPVNNSDNISDPTANSANNNSGPSNNNDTNGPGSTGGTTNTSLSDGTLNSAGNLTVNNNIGSDATSGDAKVAKNTTAGDATTGNAQDVATLINLLQSSTALQGGNFATFNKDIYGDVQGDIMIDPSQLGNVGSLDTNNTGSNTTINAKDSGQINNDVTLDATSGDAKVVGNTTAGNATTGSADAIANIMNVINSVIASGQSFVGSLNIHGNLNGDILMPPDVLNSLLASNSTNSTSTNTISTTNVNATDNTAINNQLALNAASGDAAVKDNTSAGNATSGSASTNITLLNLTGRQIIGSDALLVFVNVTGQWIGMIVNAPAGTTAAALGGGITGNSASSNSTTNVNAMTDNSINNNININANSGNALVADNTHGGSATSGNALAGVNLVNISNSELALTNWLGVLFINIFGNWNGSFGINTAAGNSTDNGSSASVASAVSQVKVFSFIPNGSGGNRLSQVASASSPDSSNSSDSQSTALGVVNSDPTGSKPAPAHEHSLFWISGSLFLLGGFLSAEEVYVRRKEARQKVRSYIRSITVQPLKKL